MTEYKKQFFRLCIEAHLADLIEEQHASIDLFEFPDALLKIFVLATRVTFSWDIYCT